MRPAVTVFASLVLLWALVAQANDALAPLHVSLYLGGLYVTFAALTLPAPSAGAVAFLAGLMCDANAFLPFGTQALLFLAVQIVLAQGRHRLPHEDLIGRIAIALLVNLALGLALTALRAHRYPTGVGYGSRGLADLIVSQIALLGVAPWFFSAQAALLARFGGPALRRL
jgi:rod shape-determining protein MreD